MTTLADVARRARVSPQTVSNVVNERDVVRPDTRARVLRAIRDLGYTPHSAARSLRTARSWTLGFVVVDPSPQYLADPFHGAVVCGIADVAREHGYGLLIRNVLPGEGPRPVALALDPRRLDGAVLTMGGSGDVRRELLGALSDTGVPLVLLEQRLRSPRLACLVGENRSGALAATNHLLARGHRAIAFLRPRLAWPAVEERIAGYRQALAAARGGLAPRLATSVSESPAAAFEATRAFLSRHPEVTAIFAANDLLAIGALQAAHDLGRAVPGELAVVGFDDFDVACYVRPRLTTVRLPGYEMGSRAAAMLLERLRSGRFEAPEVRVPTTLVVRESS